MRKKRNHVFVNYLRILPIWRILFLLLFASFGIHELFLFLFVQKLDPRIYSYSYSREKLLFADHCYKPDISFFMPYLTTFVKKIFWGRVSFICFWEKYLLYAWISARACLYVFFAWIPKLGSCYSLPYVTITLAKIWRPHHFESNICKAQEERNIRTVEI